MKLFEIAAQSYGTAQYQYMVHKVRIPPIMANLYATFHQWYPEKNSPFAPFERRLNKLAALYRGAKQRVAPEDMVAIIDEYNAILPKVQAIARDKKLHEHRRIFKHNNHPGHGAKFDREYWRKIDEILDLVPEDTNEPKRTDTEKSEEFYAPAVLGSFNSMG